MCGIFGILSTDNTLLEKRINTLAECAEQRGKDSSGLVYRLQDEYQVIKGDIPITELLSMVTLDGVSFIAGHSRLATNGIDDNQPVILENTVTLHNGIICNTGKLWEKRERKRQFEIDSEIIPVIIREHLERNDELNVIAQSLFSQCEGVISCATLIPESGEVFLFSNNGSLYLSEADDGFVFSSESWPLTRMGCHDIRQIKGAVRISLPKSILETTVKNVKGRARPSLLPNVKHVSKEAELLEYPTPNLKRCTACLLPETMPYIRFDSKGVCNYCHNYSKRNQPKPTRIIHDLIKPYRRKDEPDCIVPFSGGRDSCYGLHLAVKELGMNPIAYTYDWGMVTDLGRRNISRMCAALGVENIIIAADIELKRKNIQKNLKAWLKRPHLGMISLLTAGDKHFFRHVETVKRQTGISLNLWGVNPLEVTHFKTGFLGIPPAFAGRHVYNNGLMSQLYYQSKRLGQMFRNPGYFNSSLFDTLSGEYWRSIHQKTDYFHLFDFWEWNEQKVDETLEEYDWEWATDTPTSWRIGDATAAFYNYVYYTVAGFTEHDTFRSNQIREGAIGREEALALVTEENKPRYESIKWYLQALDIDFSSAIKIINQIPKLYSWEKKFEKPALEV